MVKLYKPVVTCSHAQIFDYQMQPATYSFESHIYKGSPQLQINTALLSFRKFALGMHSAEKNVVISL